MNRHAEAGPPMGYVAVGIMKLLLTSAGIKNPSIHDALVGLLGKPIAEASVLRILSFEVRQARVRVCLQARPTAK